MIDIRPFMAPDRIIPAMAQAGLSSGLVAGISVGVAVLGMFIGTALVLSATYQSAGWLLFVLSFGAWLGAALLALREGWHRGWFDH